MGERESSHTRTHGRRDEIKEGDEKRHPANTQKERAERKEGGKRSKAQSTCETNEMEGRREEELANGVSTHTHTSTDVHVNTDARMSERGAAKGEEGGRTRRRWSKRSKHSMGTRREEKRERGSIPSYAQMRICVHSLLLSPLSFFPFTNTRVAASPLPPLSE